MASHGPEPGPLLSPLSEQQVARALPSGAGCELRRGGDMLVVSVGDQAIARIDGQLTELTIDALPGPEGARFRGAGYASIRITPIPGQSRRLGETLSWPARVETFGHDGASSLFQAIWTCGA